MLPVGTSIFPDETLLWKEKIGLFFLIPLIAAALLAPLFYWLHPKLHLRHRRKKVKKKLFQTFIETHNFKVLNDGYVVGKIDNYIVIMYAAHNEFQGSKWIEFQVIFNPKQQNQYISHTFINRMIRKYGEKNVTWHINSVLIKQQYALKLPKYEVVYPLLKRCISELKANAIAPISYNEWERMLPETQKHLDKLEKL